MIIVEKNVGEKIDYEIQNTPTKKKITFDDDLTLNLAKREEDWPVHIDICFDADRELVIGTAAGRAYVAEIDIPAREYIEREPVEGEDPEPPTPVPLDLDKVTLSLWSIE
jgi:hypothetical protein